MAKTDILLESGTNELEILELFITGRSASGGDPEQSFFGVNVAKVMQVIESPQLTPPESASNECYMGTISLRKHIVPVLDLAVWLGIEREPHPFEVVMVTEFSKAVTGFLVSGVTEIHRVGWGDVAPPHEYVSRMGSTSIIGMVNRNKHFIQLLDLEQIITSLEMDSTRFDIAPETVASRKYRALVVDDSPTIRMMLSRNLQAANFELQVTGNGQEAFEYAQHIAEKAENEGRPVQDYLDIVIADIEMPLMDGFTLTRRIKEDDRLTEIPVILYSSLITKELRHKGESVGAVDQISKPDMDQMAERAISILEGKKLQGL
ncbi:chemotaxis protein [Desulfobaculum bizertense]|uniref:Two-component system, chemotaxis family, response regulator CheV n=1 Tax=Desulfobaculum bizertense DSM 18034 TaxID=1121442 RepID=A0A1T4WM76_9BACT|nr:chemotaxis protein [Desulfobaculum bizertense]UIJ37056.1 chemotaxis protein [Desulfobaculum bizertense]SKA78257.1 two-component system, chemotaxis family, response regulator CheV [Desulfobaculum bizertense DSM 18034]